MGVVRAASANDQEAMEAIIQSSPGAADWFEGYPALVIERTGQVAGFVLYRLVADQGEIEGEILNLAVAPSMRRHGLGGQLLAALLPLANRWFLEVRQSNTAALALYRTAGFTVCGQRKHYYADGEDAVLMTLKLPSSEAVYAEANPNG
jgi:ribosomal-protein-alanine N-acetyltransferase